MSTKLRFKANLGLCLLPYCSAENVHQVLRSMQKSTQLRSEFSHTIMLQV
jgi:hypothetical protein